MRASDGGGGWSPTTDFEQFSHAQLFDMVNESSPASISSIANTLNSASTQIQSIADDLNTHINQLPWEGTAAESFRAWGRQVVQAVDDLAIFHNNAGLAVQTAGDTLSSVKVGMPPVPTADINLVQNYVQQESCKVPSGPPTVIKGRVQLPSSCLPSKPGEISQSDAYAAQARVDAAHQEAVTQMEKLGGAYNGATQTMDINTEPQFPPPPTGLMPPPGSGIHSSVGVTPPGGSTSSSGAAAVTGTSTRGGSGGGSLGGQPAQGKSVHQAPPPPGQSGGTATLQGTHSPSAGPGPVKSPGASGGSTASHGPGGAGGGTPPPGAGTGVLAPPAGGAGSTRRGGTGKGESQPGDHSGEPGTGSGTSRGGLGGAKAGASAAEGAGGSVAARSALPAGEGGGASGGGAPGEAAGGGAAGSSTARSGLPTEEGAGARASTSEATGGSTGGSMMGGGMGGLGHAAGRGRGRARRAPYYTEDAKTWATDSTGNPAVLPAGDGTGARGRGGAAEAIGGDAAGASNERPKLPAEGSPEVSAGAGEAAARATAGGPRMGGLGNAGHRHPRGRRGSYFAEDEDMCASVSTNPAVIE